MAKGFNEEAGRVTWPKGPMKTLAGSSKHRQAEAGTQQQCAGTMNKYVGACIIADL